MRIANRAAATDTTWRIYKKDVKGIVQKAGYSPFYKNATFETIIKLINVLGISDKDILKLVKDFQK